MSLKINTSSLITLERYCHVKYQFTNYTLFCKIKVIKTDACQNSHFDVPYPSLLTGFSW